MTEKIGTPLVVIIGAGPTGLATAIELGRRGINCRIFERGERAGHAPRAKTTHVRTREFMRIWGIAEKLAAVAPFGIAFPTDVHFVTRLNGHSLMRFADALNCSPKRNAYYSEHGQWLPQYKLEAVMREHALSLGTVAIEYGKEFVSLTQGDQGVQAQIRSVANDEIQIVVSDYLVGADGARSRVRDEIGSVMEGAEGLSRNYNVIFEAPGLADAHSHGPGVMYWQVNEDVSSIIGPMDEGDLWFFMPTKLAAGVRLTDREAVDAIRISTGIDLPYRILSSDEWIASALLADKHREGRVFLAGDACHLHPPLGGFGMNMGVADGVDIGWKLAAVLQEWGGPALLDSYQAERRPTHRHVIDAATSNHAVLTNNLIRPHIEDDTAEGEAVRAEVSELIRKHKSSEFYALGIVLGCRYLHSPVIRPEQDLPEWTPTTSYAPSAAPGALAPHAWLDEELSLYDLFGNGFTLLVIGDVDAGDIEAATSEADRAGIPLSIVHVQNSDLAELYEADMALIRPDQYVAWRGSSWPSSGILSFSAGFGPSASDCGN